MNTDIGEYIVGAYLQLIQKCDFVDYNVRRPGGGLMGLDELDVLGLDFKGKAAYLCQVTTHIQGALYKDNQHTVRKITNNYKKQMQYAEDHLPDFKKRHYMFWSPYVHEGYVTRELEQLKGLDLVVNRNYALRMEELKGLAKALTHDTGNPFFRILQILECSKKRLKNNYD